MSEHRTRREIVDICRRMYSRGLISGADGNVSARLTDTKLLITPSGVPKARVRPEELVVVDTRGRIFGKGLPSSEMGMHLAVYSRRPRIAAAIHAHPPWTIAVSLHDDVRFDFAPEAIASLAGVFRAPYARPGTPAVAASIVPGLEGNNTYILTRHGSLTLGDTLTRAYNRLENLEHNAQIALLARASGELTGLPAAEVSALRAGAPGPAKQMAGSRVRHQSRIRVSDEDELVDTLRSDNS